MTAGALGARSWTWVPSGVTSRTRVRSPPPGASWQASQKPSGDQAIFCTSHGTPDSPSVGSGQAGSATAEPSGGSGATKARGRPSRSEIQASIRPSGEGTGWE